MANTEYVDLEGAPEASGLGAQMSMVEPGIYTARFSADEINTTKNGFPQVVGKWTITEGEFTGSYVREWVVFAPKSAPFLKLRFRALGLPIPPRMPAADLAQMFARKANGRLAQIVVAHRTRETDGKQFPEVVNLVPLGAASTGRSVVATEAEYDPDAEPF